MLVLGIESSCDETAAAVVEDARLVRSSIVSSQHEIHAKYGGVVPELASRAHAERIVPAVQQALAAAGATLADIDAVAVGHRPGLIGALLVGVSAAKALAWSLNKPLIGVDHVHAHLWAGMLQSASDAHTDPADHFPAIGLVVSGGHSSIYRLDTPASPARLGGTIDDAMGEAYDKAAAILGLPHPGGPNLDRLAESPGADDRAYDLPVSRLSKTSLDFSFSGLKTAVLYAARGVPDRSGVFPRQAEQLTPAERRDLAASFQRAACRAVLLKLTRAIEQWEDERPRTLLVGGGVSANSRLRRELAVFAHENRLGLVLPEMQYCVDNAAMIAGLGSLLLGHRGPDSLALRATPTTAC